MADITFRSDPIVIGGRSICSDYKIELFYYLATGWLDRAMSGIKDNSNLERWWGRSDYAILKKISAHERMVLFCDRMKAELGYKHAYGWQIFSREVGGRVMYHMIHATDHDEVPRLMNRAYRNALKRKEAAERVQRISRRFGATPARPAALRCGVLIAPPLRWTGRAAISAG